MIVGLDADFWLSLLFLFLLFSWAAQLVCSQGISAGTGSWSNGMSWGKKVESLEEIFV